MFPYCLTHQWILPHTSVNAANFSGYPVSKITVIVKDSAINMAAGIMQAGYRFLARFIHTHNYCSRMLFLSKHMTKILFHI